MPGVAHVTTQGSDYRRITGMTVNNCFVSAFDAMEPADRPRVGALPKADTSEGFLSE